MCHHRRDVTITELQPLLLSCFCCAGSVCDCMHNVPSHALQQLVISINTPFGRVRQVAGDCWLQPLSFPLRAGFVHRQQIVPMRTSWLNFFVRSLDPLTRWLATDAVVVALTVVLFVSPPSRRISALVNGQTN